MICRLCLNDVEQCFGIFSSRGILLNTAYIISQHFWFEPKQSDPYSNFICENCWSYVKNFNSFYILIQNAHKVISTVKSDIFEIKPNIENIATLEEEINFKNDLNALNCTNSNFKQETQCDVQKNFDPKLNDEINESGKNCNYIKNEFVQAEYKPRRSLRNHSPLVTFATECESILDNLKENRSKNEQPIFINHKFKENGFDFTKKVILFSDEEISKIRTLNCNNCSAKLSKFSELKKHMEEVHGENGYAVCCDKKFFKRYKFINHLQMHLHPEEFKCPHCDKRLGSKKYVKLHIKNMHTENGKMKKFSCDQCKKTFAQKAYLERHKLGHIPDSEKHFICENCGNRFPTPALLRIHTLNVHESRHSAICDLCGKKYKSPADLKRHRLEHMGIHEPKVQCETCGDWLSNKYKLKRHMLKHTTGDVEHRCPICNKISANLIALKSHMRLHVAVRKFQCTVCDKGFRRSLNLKEHMTTHTGEALYSCPNCPRTFTHHSNLHHHRKKIHPKELEEDKKIRNLKISDYNKSYGRNSLKNANLNMNENNFT